MTSTINTHHPPSGALTLSRFCSFENSIVPAYRHQNRRTEKPLEPPKKKKAGFRCGTQKSKVRFLVVKNRFSKTAQRECSYYPTDLLYCTVRHSRYSTQQLIITTPSPHFTMPASTPPHTYPQTGYSTYSTNAIRHIPLPYPTNCQKTTE
ncbi:hypothetical protein L873DRAFT_173534 [Choiromyces venosus 120613-1]|uniref:Uncharacterized protein n=1 Tax=Choiromyces venosus 120613-1 TaxID=1336337 RepID=A0A3N4JZR5_9PEZI|nr:hypothetical protein L873DRAFT_173534 [Choiromyces venosus 120613-1]